MNESTLWLNTGIFPFSLTCCAIYSIIACKGLQLFACCIRVDVLVNPDFGLVHLINALK